MESVSAQKKKLRRTVLERRDAVSGEEQEAAAFRITEEILVHPWYLKAETVLGFASYGSEIGTGAILRDVLSSGKKLYLPRIMDDEMIFLRVYDLDRLQAGYKGIREPAPDGERFCYKDCMEEQILMLMPGVAFDAEKARMGYGKGFYDRFLSDKPQLMQRTIAIGHRCQLVEKIPCEDTDIRPAKVICV